MSALGEEATGSRGGNLLDIARGHPRGLYVLFFSETWAYFSFFGMQAMLVYYMTKELGFSQGHASVIYGGYVAAAWLTPLFGGLLADRVLGLRLSVVLGGTAMALGHFMMAFEPLFFPALVLIALGNGAFVPPLISQVGRLYREDDSKRDQAYSLYYMGVNIGAFLAPFVCGTLGEWYGWHWGFAAAGVGMAIGLGVYLLNQASLPPDPLDRSRGGAPPPPLGANGWAAVRAILIVAAVIAVFRIAFEQSGNTIALWVDANSDRMIRLGEWSFLIPATWFQSINPLLIFTAMPVLAALWERQARRGTEPATIVKMSIGCGLVALSFVLMVAAAFVYQATGKPVSWVWVAGFFIVLTLGELFCVPVGLSLVSRLAPPQTAAAMIGVWYLAKFAGNFLSGYFGTLWSVIPLPLFFAIGALTAAAAGLALFLLRGVIADLEAKSSGASAACRGSH